MARLVVGASDLTNNVVASAIAENSQPTPEAHSHWRNDKVGIIANGVLGNVTGYATLTQWLSSPTGGFRWAWNPNQMGGTLNLYTYVAVATPTALAIDLEGFQVETTGKQLHFRWRTGLEANSLGFHIIEERAGKRLRLTPDPIAGSSFLLGSQQTSSGQIYQWSTLAGRNSAGARYWLEEIDLQGKSTLHGPFTARQASPATDLVARTSSPLLSEVSQAPAPAEAGPPRDRTLSFLAPCPLRPGHGRAVLDRPRRTGGQDRDQAGRRLPGGPAPAAGRRPGSRGRSPAAAAVHRGRRGAACGSAARTTGGWTPATRSSSTARGWTRPTPTPGCTGWRPPAAGPSGA